MTPKEYEIKSLKDICNTLTIENKDRFLADLTLAFSNYIEMIAVTRAAMPELSTVPNTEICEYEFTWVDDGKSNNIIATTIETEDTEIIIRPKK